MENVYITGLGTRLGSKIVTIEEIFKNIPKEGGEVLTEKEMKGLKRRSGINQIHRFSETENLRDVALDVARQVVGFSKISVAEVSGVYSSTASNSGDYDMPSLARILGQDLGLQEFRALPIGIGCVGGLDALLHASLQLTEDTKRGKIASYLVVCGDHISRTLNPKDKTTIILFSEGVASLIVTNKRPENGYGIRTIDTLCLPGDGFCMSLKNKKAFPNSEGFYMNGKAVSEFVLDQALPRLIPLLGLDKIAQTYYVAPHQGSAKIVDWVSGVFNIPRENVYNEDIGEIGNLVGASYMFAFYNALRKGYIQRDQTVVPIAFGADLKAGGMVLEPIGEPRRIIGFD
jgi:3-oxoacyl-[acyl-carrier-protein] synthase III